MGAILGLGVTHYPAFSGTDAAMNGVFKWALEDPALPESLRDSSGWPEGVLAEWRTDEGLEAAAEHRSQLTDGFRSVRQALDDFAPDFVLVVGDDQHENFRADVIPPYAVLAYGDLEVFPWRDAQASGAMVTKANAWNETAETRRVIHGHREAALHVVEGLLERDFDVAYAYEPLHHPGLAHAFLNTVLYLDVDRVGFDYPVVSLALNAYGRRVISARGFLARLGSIEAFDPPSPSPRRLFDLGAALADVLVASPWRVALVASSSWSHAFLCDDNYHLYPDHAADREMYDALLSGDWGVWRNRTLEQIEHAAQQELLNWYPLAGAMATLGRGASWTSIVETWIFNSNKVFAIFSDGS